MRDIKVNFFASALPHQIKGKLKRRSSTSSVVYRFKCRLCDMDYVGYTNEGLNGGVALTVDG